MGKIHYLFDQGFVSKDLNADLVHDFYTQSLRASDRFREQGLESIFDVLDRVADLWRGKDSPYRQEARSFLLETTGFSPEMIDLGLDELPALLNRFELKKKIRTELRGIPVGHGYQWDPVKRRALQFQPLGSVLHVLSGNVFLVGPGSLIEGLLTGNVTILKMSSQERLFLPLFMKSLEVADPQKRITSSVAIIEYSSQEKDLLTAIKKAVDGIVVWGGEEAIQAYRNDLPARTRVVVFGPKLSFGLVTRKGATKKSLTEIASAIGQELAIWDQNACTAPQSIFVESDELAQALVNALPAGLQEWEKKIPSGAADPDTAVEIRKLRGIYEIAEPHGEAKGPHRVVDSGLNNLQWTVLMDRTLALEPSPLHRTIRIIPYQSLDELEKALSSVRGYLQTVGLACSTDEKLSLAPRLARLGAQRIFDLGQMFGGEIDDPHDGQYDLPQLLTLAVSDFNRESESFHPWDVTDAKTRAAIQENLLLEVVSHAKKAPFYAKKLKDHPITSLADLSRFPLLFREDWESSMFPSSNDLQTSPNIGGYITRSGGSSGVPKFSYFDARDWSAMLASAVRVFRAAGFRETDRIANFMGAGDLYGSFISFNHVNFELGAQNYCFAQSREAQQFLDLAKLFHINAVQGIPSVLMEILRQVKVLDPKFQMEKLMYAGQPLSQSDRDWLKNELGTQVIASIIGTTEANQVGYQCEHLSGTDHHVVEDYNHLEIIDEDGNPCPPGVSGRLVVTNLQKHNYPVLRYSIGDAAKWSPSPCACGRLDRVLTYQGRWDDIVCIGRMNLKYADLRAAIEHLPLSQLQIVARFEKLPDGRIQEKLIMRIETSSTAMTPEQWAAEVDKNLDAKVSEFYQHHHSGELQVITEVLPAGSISRNPRTGKVKSLVDERV